LKKNFCATTTFGTFGTRFLPHFSSIADLNFQISPSIMKKQLFLLTISALFLGACKNDASLSDVKNAPNPGDLTLLTKESADLQFKNLRLYPVQASAALSNLPLNQLHTLAEAMQKPGFRILEQKQFGRGNEPWYHGVTVQNKTQDTVLLLSGDVVQVGNQDRVIAHHEVIMPMTVRNIEVFCVEAGRSTYYDPAAPAAEKRVAAFKGYYNIASPQVRRAIQNTGNQQEVWDAVAKVTKANGAESATQAYTALDREGEGKAQRDAYLNHLKGAFANQPDIVGVVAVCGDKVLGVDIFGTPALFRGNYTALLHGYVAEAALAGTAGTIALETVQHTFEKVARLSSQKIQNTPEAGKFVWNDTWVHLYGK